MASAAPPPLPTGPADGPEELRPPLLPAPLHLPLLLLLGLLFAAAARAVAQSRRAAKDAARVADVARRAHAAAAARLARERAAARRVEAAQRLGENARRRRRAREDTIGPRAASAVPAPSRDDSVRFRERTGSAPDPDLPQSNPARGLRQVPSSYFRWMDDDVLQLDGATHIRRPSLSAPAPPADAPELYPTDDETASSAPSYISRFDSVELDPEILTKGLTLAIH